MKCANCYDSVASMLAEKINVIEAITKTAEEASARAIADHAEIQTLRAKVASADVLVEALTMLLTTREYKEVNGKDYVYDAMRITAWDMAEKALATYDKLSEVKHDTK